MCGIAGVLTASEEIAPQMHDLLGKMNRAQKHRGPDDEGLWVSPNGAAGLAHVRLSILDLSSAGKQPMGLSEGRLQITFNGEIYNFRDLKSALEAEGVVFTTGTDTEVLLRLYEREGHAMLTKLRGMFAFAIWDEVSQRCFMARDPLGIKPLYYSVTGDRLAFASELRALLSAGMTQGELDPLALMQYFVTGTVAEPQTLFSDVHVLDAGHYLTWERGTLSKCRYWQVQFNPEPMSCEEAVMEVRSALLDSMQAHFESDVPVGLFLSGGIDSTAIAALAGLVGQRDLATFSVGVDDDKLDESGVARRTAAHFGTRHQELRLNAATAKKRFEEFLVAMDQPTIDGFNTFTVAAFAREQGMKVVLSGLGGDELFGGYKSFEAVPRLHRWSRLAGTIPGLRNGLGRLLERLPSSHKARRIGSLLRSEGTVRDAHLCFRGIYSHHEARQLAAGYLGCDPRDILAGLPMQLHGTDSGDAVSECELRFYMRNQLLKDSDVMSMAHGLELRVPLVDHSLFQRVSRVPAEWRLRRGKRMLLEAVPEVPEWVATAPKRGFVFPFERWIADGWEDDFARAGDRTPFAHATWYQKWSIFVLDHWLARL